MKRRDVLGSLAAALASNLALPALARPAVRVPAGIKALRQLEQRSGGRLGAFVRDTASGQGFGWREGERFALCSTFKLSLAALVLREVAAGRLDGGQVLPYSALDLLPASPITGAHVARYDLSVLALAEAAQTTSDNTAANLLLDRLGGPVALTAFWRELGDGLTTLNRSETALNRTDPRSGEDSTTPMAMATTLTTLMRTGPGFPLAARDTLLGWMRATTTGGNRIRAGIPVGWSAGDKTGTFSDPAFASRINDIALIEPPGRAMLVVAVYYESAGPPGALRTGDEAVLAEVGRIACDPGSWRLKRP
ncbi:class A beta-lactamase [Novosphingobium sp. FKTRR1]|uniref:class A beta-lactamase n=1 Tax=Novosphingobium sp. FKTRR1 TaxID=2879118 RepID=UPI001CF054C4|nr:class A beta-lactamase [Novosphingobium sp. FKTRR1]